MEAGNFYDQAIFCEPFLERVHLQDRRTGFLRGSKQFTRVSTVLDSNTTMMIFDNIEPNAPDSLKYSRGFAMLHQIKMGEVWVEIYRRR